MCRIEWDDGMALNHEPEFIARVEAGASNDFNMFHGERVRYRGKHPLLKDEEGVVVGGDAHQFVIKWDKLEWCRWSQPV